jgi:CBS domain-containing protein
MHADPARVAPVSTGMTRDPETIDPDASVGTAMDLMLDGGFRHLPVTEGGMLVGVVSRGVAAGWTSSGQSR